MAKKVSMRVTCPHCKHILVLDRNTGEILSTHEPAHKEDTGDPFEDALKKVKRQKDTADERFEASKEAALFKDPDAERKFDEALDEARKDPDAGRKPLRDIDLD